MPIFSADFPTKKQIISDSRVILGSLISSEDTTVDFRAVNLTWLWLYVENVLHNG